MSYRILRILITLLSFSAAAFARETKSQKIARANQFWALVVSVDMLKLSCPQNACETEALAWADEAARNFSDLKDRYKNATEISDLLTSLRSLIIDGAPASAILAQADQLTAALYRGLDEQPVPTESPNFEVGQSAYLAYCAQCHGEKGDGRGPLAMRLKRGPTNFLDERTMAVLSPASIYAAARVGVKGRDMPGYAESISNSTLWNIAFYVSSLPFSHSIRENCTAEHDLLAITIQSNSELAKLQTSSGCEVLVAQVRKFRSFDPKTPRVLQSNLPEAESSKKWGRYWSGGSFVLVVLLFLVVLLRVRS